MAVYLQRVAGMLRLIITSGLSLCQNRQLTSSKALHVKNKVFLLHAEPKITLRQGGASESGGIAVEHLFFATLADFLSVATVWFPRSDCLRCTNFFCLKSNILDCMSCIREAKQQQQLPLVN